MSQSNRNPNYPQQLSATCPKGKLPSAGRAFTLTDLNSARADSAYENLHRCQDLSATEGSNPLNDRESLGKQLHLQRAQQQHHRLRELNTKKSRLNLECEMLRNKELALERLKAEQLTVCGNRPRSQKPVHQAQEAQAQLPKGHMKPAHVNVGCRIDPDRVYDINRQPCVPHTKEGRPVEVDRDVTYQRLNLPTPKEHRARSCPTTVQRITSHPSVQRMPKVCPRPAQPACFNTSRSISASRTRYNVAPEQLCSEVKAQLSVTRICPTTDSPNTVTTLMSASATRIIPQKASTTNKSSRRSPSRSNATQSEQTQQKVSQQDTSLEMDSAYGRTPPRGVQEYYIKTPGRSDHFPNVSLQYTSTPATPHPLAADSMQDKSKIENERNMAIANQSLLNQMTAPTPPCTLSHDPNCEIYREMQRQNYLVNQNRSLKARQRQANQAYRENESYYYNASMFNEPSHYRRQSITCPENSCVDLTDETQYVCDNVNISDTDAYVLNQQSRRNPVSWRIPSANTTCIELTDSSQQSVIPINDTTGAESGSTQYIGIPSFEGQSKCPPQICPPCEQPKASLFQCLARKLGSIYNFLSSPAAPERPAQEQPQPEDQAAEQVSDLPAHEPNQLFPGSKPEDTTSGLRNLLAAQGNKATALGMNMLFATESLLKDGLASIREYADVNYDDRAQLDNENNPQDNQCNARRKAEIENLVLDAYCPGIIQETIDGRKNFNSFAQDLRGPLTEDSLTFLEAFSLRIEKEKTQITESLKENATQEQVLEIIQQYFGNQHPSDLNRSIKSFLLAAHLYEQEQVEKSKGNSMEAEVQKWVTAWPNNTKVKLISYIGRTKPTNDEKTS